MEPRRGAAITVFGRLASGVTLENAQAELTSFGKRLAAEQPTTHAQLQPHVLPYTQFSVNNADIMGMMALIYFFDGRIDDPDAGWKGRGLRAAISTRTPFYMEGGKGATSKAIRFQLRPDPLAR